MTRINTIFQSLRSEKRAALMPFLTAGYPSINDTVQTILALDEAGASIVEIGIPYSDPIADGPVIAQAMYEAIQAGTTPRTALDAVASVREKTDLGLIAMVSDSIVTRMGPARFVEEASQAGIDGLIVPDIDLTAAAALAEQTRDRGMTLSMLIASTTSPQRRKQLISLSTGFVYLLARAGITGERDGAPDIQRVVSALRQETDLPIAVGFGISRPEHVAAVTAHADAAIVGSALVRIMGEAAKRGASAAEAAGSYARELAAGLRHGSPAAVSSPPAG